MKQINDSRSNLVFPCTISIAVALSLFGGRWISYIGIASINLYLLDFLYFIGIFGIFVRNLTSNVNRLHLKFLSFLFILFFGFQLLSNSSYLWQNKIRDLVPFIYLMSTPIVQGYFREADWRFAFRACRTSVLLCAIWSDAVMLEILHPITINPVLSNVPIFSPRWDASGMSLCIGVFLWRSHPGLRLKGNLLIRTFLVLSILLLYSRASLVALFLLFIIIGIQSIFERTVSKSQVSRKKYLQIAYLFAITFLFLQYFLGSLPENSSFNRIGISSVQSVESILDHNKTSGTARGRLLAQRALINWVDTNDLQLVGSGAGSDMMIQSGGFMYLSGERDVRAPHSWPVSCYARFGILGFLFWHISVFTLLQRPLSIFNYSITITLIIYIVSLFGVILESPFGAMPFSFFLACNVQRWCNKRQLGQQEDSRT